MSISPNHPLRRLFADLLAKELPGDYEIAAYVGDLLVDFVHVDNLYRIPNCTGKRLEEVGEMLVESNPALNAPSFDREREVRKHIGDYTLFLTGMFPEYVASLSRRRGMRLDSLVDYTRAGKESYRIVAAFDQFEYRRLSPLFRRLAERFEYCVYGLNRVKLSGSLLGGAALLPAAPRLLKSRHKFWHHAFRSLWSRLGNATCRH